MRSIFGGFSSQTDNGRQPSNEDCSDEDDQMAQKTQNDLDMNDPKEVYPIQIAYEEAHDVTAEDEESYYDEEDDEKDGMQGGQQKDDIHEDKNEELDEDKDYEHSINGRNLDEIEFDANDCQKEPPIEKESLKEEVQTNIEA